MAGESASTDNNPMSYTRRTFLNVTPAAAASVARAASPDRVAPAAGATIPTVRFGKADVSRLIVGSNHFYGFSHFNRALDATIREWNTPERVCAALHACQRNGINTFQYNHRQPRNYPDLQRFQAEGGKLNLLTLASDLDPAVVVKAIQPLALVYHGEMTDRAFQNDTMDEVREYTKKARQTGVMVGVSTHKPEVIQTIEEQGWDVDCYFACAYNRTRTREELTKLLNEVPVPANEVYLSGDPARMYKVVRQTRKTCFVFKILAAGRATNSPQSVEQAFRTAYESIKPNDCVMVGMSQRSKDEVTENAQLVQRILGRKS